jgi:nicotinamidase-related amidase
MSRMALLLLDLQQGLLERCSTDRQGYLKRISDLAHAARSVGIVVIYVKTCFRRGYPEISSRNLPAARLNSHGGFVEGDPSVAFPDSIAPLQEDIVVTKRKVSALSGTELEVVLRGLSVETLVLTGIATSGAVLSTLRQAADLDYSLTVLEDLCLDTKPEVHRMLMEHVFPRQARVVGAEQWVEELKKGV